MSELMTRRCRPVLFGPVPDLVLNLAAAGGVDAVGVPAWLGHPVRDYLTSHNTKFRCGSVVSGDNWCWWFVPPESAAALPATNTDIAWPAPSRYIRLAGTGIRRQRAPLAPGSPGAALCTHPILLNCAIHAFRLQRPASLPQSIRTDHRGHRATEDMMSSCPSTDDDTRQAGQAVRTALRAADLTPFVGTGDGDWAVTAALVADPDQLLADVNLSPNRPATDALAQALHQLGIDAEAALTDGAVPLITVRLRTAQDARSLADHVLAHLPPPHAAAHRLRRSLARAGIRADETAAHQDAIEVGFVGVQHALALLSLLPGPAAPELQRPVAHWDWSEVESLADHLALALEAVAAHPVSVDAEPACATCIQTRDHGVRIGYLTEQQAHRLAAIAGNATPPA
jgi:hypothetical protein